jgi:hypothetical protein
MLIFIFFKIFLDEEGKESDERTQSLGERDEVGRFHSQP